MKQSDLQAFDALRAEVQALDHKLVKLEEEVHRLMHEFREFRRALTMKDQEVRLPKP